MKPHRILKDFPGTQDGQHDRQEFKKDTIADLSPGLAAIVVKEGWAEPATPTVTTAKTRETKVTGPDETKPLEADTIQTGEDSPVPEVATDEKPSKKSKK